jgi:tetracycline 7-halogenase / FADH2 O2-dependent halogenase
MIREHVEIAVLGAGFAGSLMAMLLHRQGRRVVLIERGSHPRFSLGESSTPLANLALEEIARDYDLPWLADLAEYGRWKRTHPHLVCGLKRGFTFVGHRNPGEELLVAASPADDVADTHWLRADFDAYLVERAVAMGVPYIDHADVLISRHPEWSLRGGRKRESLEVNAMFLIDATGPAGVLAKKLQIDTSPEDLWTRSRAVYSHFTGVGKWEDLSRDFGGRVEEHPYRCDDAALHHVLDEGWMYVLPFDNGVTSAGLLLKDASAKLDKSMTPEEEWRSVIGRYPGVARQFANAVPIRPFERTRRLQRAARQVAGPNWAMLAPSAYTLDALYSTGNGHAIHTIRRLARVIERGWGGDLEPGLRRYQSSLLSEIEFVDRLVAATYRSFRHFGLLSAFAMYYFAGAITAEERRKQGKAGEDDEFLHSHDPDFYDAVVQGHRAVAELANQESPDIEGFRDFVAREIAPWNTVGLCDPRKHNLYPYG